VYEKSQVCGLMDVFVRWHSGSYSMDVMGGRLDIGICGYRIAVLE
jgi:hypothetical protein